MSSIRRVWVTRAEPGASRTAARLAALGFEPVVAPVLRVRPLARTVPDLAGVSALAFTSRNGVAAFAALTDARHLPVFTVGDATAGAARDLGFPVVRSADGDLRALARLLVAEGPRSGRVLVPGALDPAGDLPGLVAGAVAAQALPLYETLETGAPAPRAVDAVLIHSPRAARALTALPAVEAALFIAISRAAAAPLDARFPGRVRSADRPDEEAILQALGNPAPDV